MSICNMMKDEKKKFAKKTVFYWLCYKFLAVLFLFVGEIIVTHNFYVVPT